MPKQEEKVTEEQAGEALRAILGSASADEPEPEPTPVPAPVGDEPQETAPVETASDEAAPASDDVESLKKRLTDTEARVAAERDAAVKRTQAIQQRSAQNEQILRDRFLRKSNVVNRALAILKAARTEQGVNEADVDRTIREIEGTMNPNSASYVAPDSEPAATVEDQAMVLNAFLNERGMSQEEADAFGQWMRTDAATALSPLEQAVARRDVDGFLRIAHNRFTEGQKSQDREKQRQDAVGAVRSVQRTQREAARAASAAPSAPRRQPTAPRAEVDVKKLTKKDVSDLLRASVEQYR